MSKRIQNLGTEWPFPTIVDAWRGGDTNFFEISQEVFDQQLSVLPPMRDEYTMSYCIFLCPEEYDFVNGEAIHTVYVELKPNESRPESRFFCKMTGLKKRNSELLRDLFELINQE